MKSILFTIAIGLTSMSLFSCGPGSDNITLAPATLATHAAVKSQTTYTKTKDLEPKPILKKDISKPMHEVLNNQDTVSTELTRELLWKDKITLEESYDKKGIRPLLETEEFNGTVYGNGKGDQSRDFFSPRFKD